MIEFQTFGKIPRLFRDIVITEKIDGTNTAIGIEFVSLEEISGPLPERECKIIDRGGLEVNGLHNVALVYAQSRKRLITPQVDNHGFARWVWANSETLVHDLGPGLHFGEWWGSGINRGYGLAKGEKRFSLFNVKRWRDIEFETPGVACVPVLYRGVFSTADVREALNWLKNNGSCAAPGFMHPEGIVVYHTAGNQLFKVTLENDDQPKSLVA